MYGSRGDDLQAQFANMLILRGALHDAKFGKKSVDANCVVMLAYQVEDDGDMRIHRACDR